jgi:hypothetical protein
VREVCLCPLLFEILFEFDLNLLKRPSFAYKIEAPELIIPFLYLLHDLFRRTSFCNQKNRIPKLRVLFTTMYTLHRQILIILLVFSPRRLILLLLWLLFRNVIKVDEVLSMTIEMIKDNSLGYPSSRVYPSNLVEGLFWIQLLKILGADFLGNFRHLIRKNVKIVLKMTVGRFIEWHHLSSIPILGRITQ